MDHFFLALSTISLYDLYALRFGQQEPSLWVKALTVATCSDQASAVCLAEILSNIGTVYWKLKI